MLTMRSGISVVLCIMLLQIIFCSINCLEDTTYLITKYSDSVDYLTVEQLQMLLDVIKNCNGNSTSSGNAKNVDQKDEPNNFQNKFNRECLTANDIFQQFHVTNGKFDGHSLAVACPLILSQVESHACDAPQKYSKQLLEQKSKPSQTEVWGLGILFVTIISLCSLMGVSVLPLMGKDFYKQLLTVLIGLAVGSLSASSVFHLVPQAFGLLNSDVHHSYLNISLMMWGGIWIFFMTERILKMITEFKQKKQHSEAVHKDNSFTCMSTVSSPSEQCVSDLSHQNEFVNHSIGSCLPANPGAIYDYQEQAIKASFGHQEKPRVSHGHEHVLHFEQGKDSAIATVAWMVIFGDGLHNFIDGLSIGAAFNESILTGISISLAVMCEEFPHELGDFAVLLNAGMTMKQALLYNFLSACTCYLGLIFGIMLGEIEASTYIFGFAAGMFLYISLVDMVPEMNEVAEEASKVSVKKACFTLLLQNIGMGIGVVALYILARYQDNIRFS